MCPAYHQPSTFCSMEMSRRLIAATILVTYLLVMSVEGDQDCEFPALYNFGDSNSDTGGIAAAFYQMGSPNGETYFHRPAGRGSDGRLIIDFIADKLGLPYVHAYLDSIRSSFRHGANFASGGSTIRRFNESWFLNGVSPFPLDIQIVQYQQFKSRTTYLYNQAKEASEMQDLPRPEDFSKALYTFDIGQNDVAAGIRTMSTEQFFAEIQNIINQFAEGIRNLYWQGGRAFWIHNTGPIGCLGVTLHNIHGPSSLGYLDRHGCVKYQNDMARQFNMQLKMTVIELRKELSLSAITYVNMYAAKYKLLSNAKKLGFLNKREICCGYHEHDVHVYCGNKAMVNGTEIYAGSCEDPSLYISWDGVHYTEAANHWIANQIASGLFTDPPTPITQACHRPQSM